MNPNGKPKPSPASRRAMFWLAQAEHHIQHRRFYLARRILQAVHDPNAHALLDDLNAIAPPIATHTCGVCGAQEFTWHRTVSHISPTRQIEYLEVDTREVFSRVCASCSSIQLFLQLPDWATLE